MYWVQCLDIGCADGHNDELGVLGEGEGGGEHGCNNGFLLLPSFPSFPLACLRVMAGKPVLGPMACFGACGPPSLYPCSHPLAPPLADIFRNFLIDYQPEDCVAVLLHPETDRHHAITVRCACKDGPHEPVITRIAHI